MSIAGNPYQRAKRFKHNLEPGFVAGGVKVLEVKGSSQIECRHWRVTVEYACCGLQRDLAYSSIIGMINKGKPSQCQKCSSESRRKHERTQAERLKEERARRPAVVFDARGQPWPFLSPLGFRGDL